MSIQTHHGAGSPDRVDERRVMPYLVATGDGAILVLAIGGVNGRANLRNGMRSRGHSRFIAWPLPPEDIQPAYGAPFEIIEERLCDEQPLRVLDYDGARVFRTVWLSRLEPPELFDA